MKVLTWNCNLRFENDFKALTSQNADVIIVQECENLPADTFQGYSFHWIGNNEKKGLGILTRGNSEFLKDIYNAKFIYFLPLSFEDTFIIGAWAFNSRAKKFGEDASGFFLEVLKHYESSIKSAKQVIIAGDFNNGPQWDVPNHPNNFLDINRAFNDLGLTSAYHEFSGENFGSESKHTHFHQRNPEKKYHIDYIYSNFTSVKSVQVGEFEEWSHLSDHVPLIAELKN